MTNEIDIHSLISGFLLGAGLVFMGYEFIITPLALAKIITSMFGAQ